MFPRRGPLRRTGVGRYAVHLSKGEQLLVKSLLAQLRTALRTEGRDTGGDPAVGSDSTVRRLFPTAYADDEERDREYRSLVHRELLDGRLRNIDLVEETIVLPEIDHDQLTAWLTTINDLRLALGTRLDVSEDMGPTDPDDPEAPALAAYEYLGLLLDHIVAALADDLPPASAES